MNSINDSSKYINILRGKHLFIPTVQINAKLKKNIIQQTIHALMIYHPSHSAKMRDYASIYQTIPIEMNTLSVNAHFHLREDVVKKEVTKVTSETKETFEKLFSYHI